MDSIAIAPIDGPLDATIAVPGSKSLTNRALVIAALAHGTSTLHGVLAADDTEAMLGALEAMLVDVDHDARDERATVHGTAGAMRAEQATVDARRSGTTARFLLPVLGGLPGSYLVTGTEQLQARPMGDLLDAIRSLGTEVDEQGEPGHLPVRVGGGYGRELVRVRGDVTSQFISGLMLVGPLLPNGMTIECTTELVSRPYVEMTAEMMRRFGAEAEITGRRIVIPAGGYTATQIDIEPDASTASYFFAAAALLGGTVRVPGLDRRSLQGDVRFVDVLAEMGAEVLEEDGALAVRGSGTLRGADLDLHDMPDMALTVAALAPFAAGPTTVTGVGVIRGHESDRIAVIAAELGRLGVHVDEDPDGFRIEPAAALRPATIQTHDDHRVAMAFALIGLRVPGVRIADPGCVAKTFPGYWGALDSLRPR